MEGGSLKRRKGQAGLWGKFGLCNIFCIEDSGCRLVTISP